MVWVEIRGRFNAVERTRLAEALQADGAARWTRNGQNFLTHGHEAHPELAVMVDDGPHHFVDLVEAVVADLEVGCRIVGARKKMRRAASIASGCVLPVLIQGVEPGQAQTVFTAEELLRQRDVIADLKNDRIVLRPLEIETIARKLERG
jgi:hypothetical protein